MINAAGHFKETQWRAILEAVINITVSLLLIKPLGIFDLAILGLGTREIAMMLNDENVPVPSVYNKENKAYGKETTYTIAPVILWDSTRVWKILTAYVYTGAMVLGKTKTLISGKSIVRTVPKGQQYITEGTHEAIVSREECSHFATS